MTKSIAVVGAGAKAAAIVARAAVLKDVQIGGDVPNIYVFEEKGIGAAWNGGTGHSSGFLTLCTPGEKDVGFPYIEKLARPPYRRAPARELHARFSWQAFQVAKGDFVNWIDRGRDHPSHSRWAQYLEWVFAEAGVKPVIAAVTEVSPLENGRWRVVYGEASDSLDVDGVVLTGSGRATPMPFDLDVGNRVLDAETFWSHRQKLLELSEGAIAVAGGGGAAGAILAWLATHLAERDVRLHCISPTGTLFTRGDGHSERRWFSDPTGWRNLSWEHRQEVLDHTESGVVSIRNKQIIDRSDMIEYHVGKAGKVSLAEKLDRDEEELAVEIVYDGDPTDPVIVDYLISAIGFDRWSLLDVVASDAATALCSAGSADLRKEVLKGMEEDLSLPGISGLPRGLHVPALADLARGPGMSNLGCLGLMAAELLRSYCR